MNTKEHIVEIYVIKKNFAHCPDTSHRDEKNAKERKEKDFNKFKDVPNADVGNEDF
jgi:hypothetical protein